MGSAPRPLEESLHDIALWAKVASNLDLDENITNKVLGAKAWDSALMPSWRAWSWEKRARPSGKPP